MKFVICHDIPGCLRIRVLQPHEMTCGEADTLEYALSALRTYTKPAGIFLWQRDGCPPIPSGRGLPQSYHCNISGLESKRSAAENWRCPALSAADVGIAVSDGAEIAREIADIMIGSDDLYGLVTLKRLSNALVGRIHRNYRVIVGFNTALILLGVGGVLQPASLALLHNTSTLAISLKSMQDLL